MGIPEIHEADLDEKAVEVAVKRAKGLLAKESPRSGQVARVEAAIARSLAKMPFRRRWRHRWKIQPAITPMAKKVYSFCSAMIAGLSAPRGSASIRSRRLENLSAQTSGSGVPARWAKHRGQNAKFRFH